MGQRHVGLEAVRDAAGDASRPRQKETLTTVPGSSSIFSPAVCFCENLLCRASDQRAKKNSPNQPPSLKGSLEFPVRLRNKRECFCLRDAVDPPVDQLADWLPFTSQQGASNRECVQWQEGLCIQCTREIAIGGF